MKLIINKISRLVKRVSGKREIYSKVSAIKGDYSQGRRDIMRQDWYRE
jgi:hypothetical protein